MITNLIITALVLTNGVAAGSQELELRPVWGQKRIVCGYCKAYANYLKTQEEYAYRPIVILPPEGECTCKFERTKIESYEVVPWVEPKKKGARK